MLLVKEVVACVESSKADQPNKKIIQRKKPSINAKAKYEGRFS